MNNFKEDVIDGSIELAILDYLSDGKSVDIEDLLDNLLSKYKDEHPYNIYDIFGDYYKLNRNSYYSRSNDERINYKFELCINDNIRSMITLLFLLYVYRENESRIDSIVDYIYEKDKSREIRFFNLKDFSNTLEFSSYKSYYKKCTINNATIQLKENSSIPYITIYCDIDDENTEINVYPTVIDCPASQYGITYMCDTVNKTNKMCMFSISTPNLND